MVEYRTGDNEPDAQGAGEASAKGALEKSLLMRLFYRGTSCDFLIDSFCLLNLALFLDTSYSPASLTLIVLGLGMLFCATQSSCQRIRLPHFRAIALFLLPILLFAQSPSWQLPRGYVFVHRVFCVAAFLLVIAFFCVQERNRKWIVFGVCAGKFCLLISAILFVPRPEIDVWQLQQYAVDYLLQGQNPYTTPAPDIYDGGFLFANQPCYAYAPLNLLVSIIPKVLFGDYRHGLAVSLFLGLLLFRRAGKRASVSPFYIDFVTLLFVLQPRLERWIIYGWMEPYMMPFLAGAMVLLLRNHRVTLPMLLFFCLPLFKQYVAVPVFLYLYYFRPRISAFLWASSLVLFATLVVFALKVHEPVYHSLLYFVRYVHFRDDSMAFTGLILKYTGFRTGAGVSLAAQAVFGALLVYLLGKRGAVEGRFLLAMAGTLWGAFLFSPQAFENYYFFILFVLFGALLLFPDPKDIQACYPQGELGSPLKGAATALGLFGAVFMFVGAFHHVFLCEITQKEGRRKMDAGRPLWDQGKMLAKATDQIFVCETTHCFGPICHPDLSCLCADRGTFATHEALEQRLKVLTKEPAHCVVDQATPKPSDTAGLCQQARCIDRSLLEP
jgi:hypothetical protein